MALSNKASLGLKYVLNDYGIFYELYEKFEFGMNQICVARKDV